MLWRFSWLIPCAILFALSFAAQSYASQQQPELSDTKKMQEAKSRFVEYQKRQTEFLKNRVTEAGFPPISDLQVQQRNVRRIVIFGPYPFFKSREPRLRTAVIKRLMAYKVGLERRTEFIEKLDEINNTSYSLSKADQGRLKNLSDRWSAQSRSDFDSLDLMLRGFLEKEAEADVSGSAVDN